MMPTHLMVCILAWLLLGTREASRANAECRSTVPILTCLALQLFTI